MSYFNNDLNTIFEDKDIEDLLEDFQYKISYSLHNTSFHERQDLEQELKMKIIEKMMYLNLETSIPGFWEFLSYYI
jgi:hypothetical protein